MPWVQITCSGIASAGTKIPLMIGCPGGKCVGRTSALVESIDIYPTVRDPRHGGHTPVALPTVNPLSLSLMAVSAGRATAKTWRLP